LNWSKIKFPGYTEEQLKDCLKEILESVPRIRTMDEMLLDYENNPLKYNMKTHPGVPKMPVNAMMRYIDDNRAKIVKKMKKNMEPGTKPNLVGLRFFFQDNFKLNFT
jgi:Cdc6-like AAA superfamily ATPase